MPRNRIWPLFSWSVVVVALAVITLGFWLALATGCSFPNPNSVMKGSGFRTWFEKPSSPQGTNVGILALNAIIWFGFIGSAGCTVLCILTGSVPFLGRIGATLFGRVAAALLGMALGAMVVRYIVGTYMWVLVGGCVVAMGLYFYGHRYALEEWAGIDFTRDGFIGKRAERIAAQPRQKRLALKAAKKRSKR